MSGDGLKGGIHRHQQAGGQHIDPLDKRSGDVLKCLDKVQQVWQIEKRIREDMVGSSLAE